MSTPIKDFRINVRLFNNQMRERREATGLSAPKFCEAHGIDYIGYIELETMRSSPLTSGVGPFGKPAPIRYTNAAVRVAAAFGVDPSVLWPESVLAVRQREAELRVDAEQMAALLAADNVLSPDRALSDGETLDALGAALDDLSPKERRLLVSRFGIDGTNEGAGETQRVLGEQIGVSHTRIAQIEQKALRKLRQNKRLRDVVNGGD